MKVIRAFIAIGLSKEIHQSLNQVLDQLNERLPGAPIRWAPAKNIHLTIKFLGNVSISNLEMLKKLLRVEADNHQPFEISLGEVGAFPSPRRPRVIWVGIQAPPELEALHRGIENETARLGYQREKRSFSPHLTIGRVSRSAISAKTQQINDVLVNYQPGFLGATRVRAVNLYQSELKPGGAVYTQLYSAPLKQPETET